VQVTARLSDTLGNELDAMEVQVVDPWVDADEAQREYGLSVLAARPQGHRAQGTGGASAVGRLAEPPRTPGGKSCDAYERQRTSAESSQPRVAALR